MWLEGKKGKSWVSSGFRFQIVKKFGLFRLTDIKRKGKVIRGFKTFRDAVLGAEAILNKEGTWS